MLISFRPLTLSTAIKSVRSRTLGIATSIHAELRTFSDHPAGELLGSAPDFSRCTRSDVDTYRLIRICDDQEKLEYTFGLLMNIVRQPYLGHLVKKIEYIHRANNVRGYPELPYQRKLSVDDMQLLKRAVGNAGFQDKRLQRVMGMLMQNDLDQDFGYTTSENRRVSDYETAPTYITQAIAAIIVSMAPNLESMAMTQIFNHHSDLQPGQEETEEYPLVEVFRYANSRPQGARFLQKLRDMYLINHAKHSDSRYFADTDLIACLELFNNLPSIESLGIDVLESNEDNGKQTCEEKSSNISKIKINHSSLDASYLLCVMASSKILTELQFTTGRRSALDGTSFFSPKAFLKGLSEHTRTLKVLDLDIEDLTIGYPGQPQPYSTINWDEAGGPGDYELDEYDESDEDSANLAKYRRLLSIWDRNVVLKDFEVLKSLSINIGFLIYFAQGVETDDLQRASIVLADCLPDHLRSLSVRGYKKVENKMYDKQVDALMARFEAGLSRLDEIKGVSELIPNGRAVENPGRNEHLLWSLEELGYPEW
ncbi:unnamed protein product [Penicillium olsonii]|nr:unnamed protein product [Penicillium olsonii]